jgi:hypothetical protein
MYAVTGLLSNAPVAHLFRSRSFNESIQPRVDWRHDEPCPHSKVNFKDLDALAAYNLVRTLG